MRYPWNFCYYDKTKIEQKMSWELGHDNIEMRMLLQKAFQPISWLKLDSLQNKSWICNLSYLSREKQCYIKTRLLIEKRVHPIALWLKPSEKDLSNCTLAQFRRLYKYTPGGFVWCDAWAILPSKKASGEVGVWLSWCPALVLPVCMYVCFPLLILRSEMFPSRRRYHLTTICPRDTYGSHLGLTWLSPKT